jgi:hypothetical protein
VGPTVHRRTGHVVGAEKQLSSGSHRPVNGAKERET